MIKFVLRVMVFGLILTGCSPQPAPEQQTNGTEQTQEGPDRDELGEATLTWDVPTTRADQSCLHDLEGFLIRWGNAPDRLDQMEHVPAEELNCTGTGKETPCGEIQRCAFTVESLQPGIWHFVVYASDSEFHLSEPSEVGRKRIEPRQ